MKKILVVLSLIGLVGCASINSLSVTPVPADRSQPVSVEAEKMIILGLNFDNDFVDSLVGDLKSKCPRGMVSGILTKDENINYFLFLVFKKKVTVSGYCTARTAALNPSKSRKKASVQDDAGSEGDL